MRLGNATIIMTPEVHLHHSGFLTEEILNSLFLLHMNVTRSLLDEIKTKQLQWYGHIQRMEEGRLPKEVMKWRPKGRRKRGRPNIIK